MTRRLVRTSFGATLLASLALGMYGAGGWVAAQIAPSDTGPSAREAAATLAAEAAEDAKLPRANGQSGGFEVTSDSAKYNVDLYFPCEPGYNTEFDPRPYRDSELNFANDGVTDQSCREPPRSHGSADLNRYIHKWDWNSVPPSTRPWNC